MLRGVQANGAVQKQSKKVSFTMPYATCTKEANEEYSMYGTSNVL